MSVCIRCSRGYRKWKKKEDWKKSQREAAEHELVYIHNVIVHLKLAIENNIEKYSEAVKNLPSQGNLVLLELPHKFSVCFLHFLFLFI